MTQRREPAGLGPAGSRRVRGDYGLIFMQSATVQSYQVAG